MSPYLRSMLEDAADDWGRPGGLDLNAVRAGGRQAIWRRRATVGGLGVGVTAVIATVAIAVGTAGGTPIAPAAGFALSAAGLNDSALPVIDAIEDAGYAIGPGGSASNGAGAVSGSGSEGAATQSTASTTIGISRDGATGTLVLADFTAIALLSAIATVPAQSTVDGESGTANSATDDANGTADLRTDGATGEPNSAADEANGTADLRTDGATEEPDSAAHGKSAEVDSTVDAATGPMCAVQPSVSANSDFRWAACARQPLGDGEIWSSDGSGTDVTAVGATLVRGDGSGFSVTLATAPLSGWFAYGPSTPPSPLAALPLTSDELADVVAKMAALDEPLLAEFTGEPAPGVTAEPSPAPVGDQSTKTTATPALDPSPECPTGDVLAQIADEAGQTSLIRTTDGRTRVCTSVVGFLSFTNSDDLTGREPPQPLAINYFGLSGSCIGGDPCGPSLEYGAQPLPAGVARISYETADGVMTDATIVDGFWMVRLLYQSVTDEHLIVRVYDASGGLLREGDLYDVPAGRGSCPGGSVPCAA